MFKPIPPEFIFPTKLQTVLASPKQDWFDQIQQINSFS